MKLLLERSDLMHVYFERYNRYDELEYAKLIEKKGFQSRFKKHELRILAKYYSSMGIKKAEIRELICKFCEEYIETYNDVMYASFINGIMNFVKKNTNKLIVIKSIPITDEEVKFIENLDLEYNSKKFLFTWLVKIKLNRQIYFISHEKELESIYFSHQVTKQREVYKMSMIPKKRSNMNNIIKELYDKEIIYIAENGKIKLLFLEKIKPSNNIAINVDTLSIDMAGYYWDIWNGKINIAKCLECGVVYKRLRSHGKYCKECARKIKIRKTIEARKKKLND